MSEQAATYSQEHPHEPEIPPIVDAEGRCLICGLLVRVEAAEAERDALSVRLAQAEQERDEAMQGLWDAYVATGSDPDGDKRWHAAPADAARSTVAAVKELAEERDGMEAAFDLQQVRLFAVEVRLREYEEALRELAGYVRAHLAGNDADPELRWALENADSVAASGGREAPDTKEP